MFFSVTSSDVSDPMSLSMQPNVLNRSNAKFYGKSYRHARGSIECGDLVLYLAWDKYVCGAPEIFHQIFPVIVPSSLQNNQENVFNSNGMDLR